MRSRVCNNDRGTYHDVSDGRVDVLLDALSVEEVTALGRDRVFGDVIAQTADGVLALIVRKLACIVLASEHQIGVARHLPHARQE